MSDKKYISLTNRLPKKDLENIKNVYSYYPINGILSNKKDNTPVEIYSDNTVRINSISNKSNRIVVPIEKLCTFLKTGEIKRYIKFKDGNNKNIKYSNLNFPSHSQIMANRRKRKDSRFNYKGVRIKKGKYACVLMIDYKFKTIAGFDTEIEAAKYYDALARHYYKEFSKPNFEEIYVPPGDERFLRKYKKINRSNKIVKTQLTIKNKKTINKDTPEEIINFLKETYEYLPITGNIRNKNTGNIIHSNNIELQNKFDYLYNIPKHRLVWFLHYGQIENLIDHIDRDPLNNKIENLRLATYSQNASNTTRKTTIFGFKGVYKSTENKYGTSITCNYKNYSISGLDSPLEASKYYDSLCRYYHKEFAVCNHVECFIPPMDVESLRIYRNVQKNLYNEMSDEEFENEMRGKFNK